MTFRALALALGGVQFPGYVNYYHIAELPLEQVRARAATAGTVERICAHVHLQFPVAEGTAVIVAALDEADVLRDRTSSCSTTSNAGLRYSIVLMPRRINSA
jgi:hypothetical protein